MKNLINSIKNKFNKAVVSAKTAIESTSGEGYIDTGVKIIIGVVIGRCSRPTRGKSTRCSSEHSAPSRSGSGS